MTLTLTCPRSNDTTRRLTVRPATDRALRDMAFVLKLTERVSREIRTAARTNPRSR